MRRTALHPGHCRLKPRGESRFPHRRDPAYLRYIRGLPCAVSALLHDLSRSEIAERGWWPCGSRPERPNVEPAHLQTQGAGGDDHGNVLPLCPAHHDEQEGRTRRFALHYGFDPYQVAADLWVDYEQGEAGL